MALETRQRLGDYNNIGQLANHLERNKIKSLSHTSFQNAYYMG